MTPSQYRPDRSAPDSPRAMAEQLARAAVEGAGMRGDPMQLTVRLIEALFAVEEAPRSPFGVILSDELVAHREWLAHHPDQVPSYLSALTNVTTEDERRGDFTTSDAVRDVAVACALSLIQPQAGEPVRVLDLACGTGKMLLDIQAGLALRGLDAEVFGSDINADVVEIAKASSAARGSTARFEVCDALTEDPFPDEWFDFAISDLPRGLRLPRDGRLSRRRFFTETNLHDASLLLVQVMLGKLRPTDKGGGRAVAFVGPANLWSSQANVFREAVTQRDWLRAVAQLPDLAGPRGGRPTPLLIFDTAKHRSWANKTQLVDLRGFFDDTPGAGSRRRVTASGLAELDRALSTPKPTAHTRTVTPEAMAFQQVRVAAELRNGERLTVRHLIRDGIDPAEWLDSRYGEAPHIALHGTPAALISWSPDVIRGQGTMVKQPDSPVGQLRPLLSATADAMWIKDNADEVADISAYDLVMTLLSGSVRLGVQALEDVEEPMLALQLREDVGVEYTKAWLQSNMGRELHWDTLNHTLRSVAPNDRLGDYLDRMLIPMATAETQRAIVEAVESAQLLRSEAALIEQTAWEDPESGPEAAARVAAFVARGSDPSAWAETLPYPLAAARRAFVATQHDLPQGNRQLRLFFEAVGVFAATHLLSGLRPDDLMWAEHQPQLARRLRQQHLSFSRATFGTWRLVYDSLRGVFNSHLDADDDDAARILNLLGGPSAYSARRLLSAEMSNCLDEVNRLRNHDDAHAGALTNDNHISIREALATQLALLQTALGQGWGDLQLVRVRNSNVRGGRWTTQVDLLTGSNRQFVVKDIPTLDPLDADHLHLVSPVGASLQLLPLVRLGVPPAPEKTTAYFFNRLEGEGQVRRVAYEFAESTSATAEEPELHTFVRHLDEEI